LGLAIGVLSFVVTFWHDALGLGHRSLGLALLAGAVATALTVIGAGVIRWALRPVEARLRDQRHVAQKAHAELDAVITASPLAIITIDTEGRVTGHWNPAAERMFGWTRDEVLGRPLPIVPPERHEEFTELRRRAFAGEPLLGLPIERMRKDGSRVHLSLSTAVVEREAGQAPELVAIVADVTPQVEANRALEFQSTIIGSLRDPIVAYDLKNWVTYWNRAAEELYGWTEAEMLGTYANERLRMEPVGRSLYEVKAMLDRDGQYRGEFTLHRRDGGTVHVESRCTTIASADGEVTGYVSVSRDLTERRQIEAELRESRARLVRLGENVPDIIFSYRLQPSPGYDYISPACTVVSGYTPEEIYRDPDIGIRSVHPEDRDALLGLLAAPEKLTGHPVVLRFFHKNGSVYWTENRHTAVRDDQGAVVAIEWVARDITDRIEAETRLRESEARFRRLSENAPDIVFRYRVRPDRGFEYVSPAVAAISGYTVEEFYADPDLALKLLPPDHHAVIETLGRRPEELEGTTLLLPWVRKDGRTIWVEQRNVLVRDAEGRVVAFEGIARDVTDRKEIEDRIARLSQVVEQSAELVLITELNGSIVYVNPAFERMTGYSAAEAVGQNPRILRSGLQGAEFYRDLWASLKRGESWAGRLRNRRKDGSLYTADAIISPVRDRNGTVVNYVGLQRDMTRESELDDQLRQAQKMEAVGQLTGGIAHDFNNLLTVILANLALLNEELREAPAPVGQGLRDIQDAAKRGSEMVRKLLAFGRQERLQPQPVNLRHVVLEFIRTVGRILPETIEFHVSAPDDLSPAQADAGAVEQILLNLAMNARDAMPTGGTFELQLGLAQFDDHGDHTVTGWHEPGAFLHLRVRDTGHGMDAVELERIFEPFFTTKPTGKGSGLGMAMVYGLMKQQHGFVTVESAPGAGTTVHLYFPMATTAAAALESRNGGDAISRGNETLLLVEDEEPIRRVAQRILEQLGYTVLTAGDGVEALAVYREHADRIHLVVSDVVMPRMNGPDLVAALRREGHAVRVLFATGYASTDILREHHTLSGARFIEKPWTVDSLARQVRELLDGPGPG
jgi:two-component system, cell cycle sensor histidine kinase and response regulator CckA